MVALRNHRHNRINHRRWGSYSNIFFPCSLPLFRCVPFPQEGKKEKDQSNTRIYLWEEGEKNEEKDWVTSISIS
jgi:hypothetical protein